MHQDALHELVENSRCRLLSTQMTIHDLQELTHSLNVFLLILQFYFRLWNVRFTFLLLYMARSPSYCRARYYMIFKRSTAAFLTSEHIL